MKPPMSSPRMASAFLVLVQVLTVVLLSRPASAQESEFLPRLELQQAYTSDVDYVGDTEESTTRTSLILGLPFRRDTPGGRLELSYGGRVDRYSDFSTLDHVEHGARVAWHSAPAARTGGGVEATYSRTQEQGDPDIDTPFLSNRTELSFLKARANVQRRMAPDWIWSTEFEASRSDLDEISGFDPGITEEDLEDRSAYRIGLGAKHDLSGRTRLGFNAGYKSIRPDRSGDEDIYRAGFTGDHMLHRGLRLDFDLGVYSRESATYSREGLEGALTLLKALERASFNLRLSHAASTGGTLPGTSTDTKVRLGFSASESRDWHWAVESYYAFREPTSSDRPDVQTAGLVARLEWRATPKLALAVRGSYNKQEADDDPTFDATVTTATFGLVWYPNSFGS